MGGSPKCSCGGEMLTFRDGGEHLFCPNCDRTMFEERQGFERRTTRRDIQFNIVWAARIRDIYGPMPDRWPDEQGGNNG